MINEVYVYIYIIDEVFSVLSFACWISINLFSSIDFNASSTFNVCCSISATILRPIVKYHIELTLTHFDLSLILIVLITTLLVLMLHNVDIELLSFLYRFLLPKLISYSLVLISSSICL
jgi:hypothetical protein